MDKPTFIMIFGGFRLPKLCMFLNVHKSFYKKSFLGHIHRQKSKALYIYICCKTPQSREKCQYLYLIKRLNTNNTTKTATNDWLLCTHTYTYTACPRGFDNIMKRFLSSSFINTLCDTLSLIKTSMCRTS